MGIGVVIRDYKGEVMTCLNPPKPFHSQPIIAKYQALWRAMTLYLELGFELIQFERDAQLLVNSINSEDECLSWYEHLVEEARQVFKHRTHWTISFVHREGNEATHILAKSSLNLYEENVQIEDVPNVVSNIIFEELSNQ